MSEPTIVMREDVESYVEAVGRRLADLPDEERADLLDELREHATSITREDDVVDLVRRLGTPDAYAAELRAAAGLPEPGRSGIGMWFRGLAARVAASRWWPVIGRLARDMTPVAWAVRGAIAVWLVLLMLGDLGSTTRLLLLGAGALVGWWAGPRVRQWSQRSRVRLWARRLVDVAVAVLAVLICFDGLTGGWRQVESYQSEITVDSTYLSANGMPVAQVVPVGADGKPVPVALFDQDGLPIVPADPTGGAFCADAASYPVAIPYRDASGQVLPNVYPLRAVCVDDLGAVTGEAQWTTVQPSPGSWAEPVLPKVGDHLQFDAEGYVVGVLVPAGSAAPVATPSSSGP